MEFNYYEKEHMKCSVSNFLNYYDIDLILNNNLVDLYIELDFYMKNYKQMKKVFDDYDSLNEIDIFQYFIFRERDLEFIKLLNEPIFYSPILDLYLLGVTHYGTSWEYVLTNINLINNDGKIELDTNDVSYKLKEIR